MKLLLVLLFLLSAHSYADTATNCDEKYSFTALDGHSLIDCRVDGASARAKYTALQASESSLQDADSGNGFVKKDAFNYCFASADKSSFQCSQTLDSQSGAALPLNVSPAYALTHNGGAKSCALTNGSDTCSATRPCCDAASVCSVASGSPTGSCVANRASN